MRSTSLGTRTFAGALSIAVITPAPAAAQDPAPTLAVDVADSRLGFGERTALSGVAPTAAAGQPVALEFREAGSRAPWRSLSVGVVRSSGRFRVRGRIPRSGLVRVRIAGLERQFLSRARSVRVRAGLVVRRRNLQLSAGDRALVAGHVRPRVARLAVALDVRRAGHWATLDSARTGRDGGYVLADRRRETMSARVRVRVSGRVVGLEGASRDVGRLDVYRRAYASWYGPGLYGNHLGCGGRLSTSSLGVAHKRLPCGTLVTFRRSGRSIRVPVIDRGPYVSGREYDLTAATARRLRFSGHGPILATR